MNQYGCIVIETQDWIDGINHPEWGRNDWQIFSAETGPAVNYATYDFFDVLRNLFVDFLILTLTRRTGSRTFRKV